MNDRSVRRQGFGVLGVGAAACLACCAGPLLALLGSVTVAGLLGTLFVGSATLILAAGGLVGFVIVRRQRATRSCTPPSSMPVELTERKS